MYHANNESYKKVVINVKIGAFSTRLPWFWKEKTHHMLYSIYSSLYSESETIY